MRTIRIKEQHIYIFLIIVLGLTYFLVRFFALDASLFGFDQLKHLKFRLVFVSYVLLVLMIFLAPRIESGMHRLGGFFAIEQRQFPSFALLIAIIFAVIFFVFRSEFINADGEKFIWKFMQDIPEKGSHVTHDEMWELYLHSRFWYVTNRFLGWSVPFSYQIISSLAGGVFVYLLLIFSNQKVTGSGYFFLGMISGGYMQLFFGDVENYTLVSVLLLLYFILSKEFIAGKFSIIAPVVILALAITFHLLAGWLLPGVLLLYWVAYKRRGYKEIAYSVLYSGLIVGLTLVFFHFNGLPISKLFTNSHALGHGGTVRMLVVPTIAHYQQIFNMLFLLFPPVVFFIPLIGYRRIQLSTFNIFLIISSICMLLLMFIWNPILGVYEDWNLFAPGMIPLAILFWWNFADIRDLEYKPQIFAGMFLLSSLHSYTWIISNHYL